jgi:hypothetical protein
VAPLHRAVALEQVDGVLVLVGQHLDLDVPRLRQELLHVDGRIAERRLRLERVSVTAGSSAGLVCTTRMPAPAAAAGRLDDHRIARRARHPHDLLRILGSAPSEPGTHGTPALFIAALALTLSPIRRIVSASGR